MKLFRNLILISTLITLSVSCSVQKRKYQRGYFVAWKSSGLNLPANTTNVQVNAGSDTKIHRSRTSLSGIGHPEIKNVNPLISGSEHRTILKGGDTCDLVRLKDSSQLNCKVLEIHESYIRYQKCDPKKNKVKRISKTKISYINYFNGTSEQIVYLKPVKKKKKKVKTDPMAVLSSIFGPWSFGIMLLTILAVLMKFTPLALLIPPVLSLCAIANGLASLKKLKDHPGEYRGKPQAIIGIVFGSLALLALFVFLLFTF